MALYLDTDYVPGVLSEWARNNFHSAVEPGDLRDVEFCTIDPAGSKDLDAVPLLLTTQAQVITTVETVADYGGSLDVILDDA